MFRASYERAPDPQAELARIMERFVIKRVGQPSDVAYAALYLTSEESAYVTGSALAVDAGRTFHLRRTGLHGASDAAALAWRVPVTKDMDNRRAEK